MRPRIFYVLLLQFIDREQFIFFGFPYFGGRVPGNADDNVEHGDFAVINRYGEKSLDYIYQSILV